MADMKLFIELLARSTGLKRELSESSSAFQRFGNTARREFDKIRQVTGSLQGQLAALGLTVGVLQQLRMSAQLDKDLTQIGQTAGAGSKMVTALRSDLFRMGKESGQDIESLKNGFDSLVQSGLSMREATSTLDGVNIAMAVTGAKAEILSSGLTVAAQAFQFDLAKPGQALELLDKMTVAGRLGTAELGSLSQIFSRVGVNAQAAGLNFDKTLGFIEALSKVERQPERLATLADSTLRVFTNMNYMKSAQQGTGIRFYSRGGHRRDPLEVLNEIKKKYDTLKTDLQRDSFVQRAFGKADLDTIKGIRTLLQSNNLSEISKMTGLVANAGGSLKRDFNEATSNLIDQAGRFKNTMRDGLDDLFKPLNQGLATWIQFMLANKEAGGLDLSGKQIMGGSAAMLGGTYLASRLGNKYLGDWASKKLGSMSASTALGVTEGKVLQAAAGITPVFVTNWPAGGLPGTGIKVSGSGSSLPSTVPVSSKNRWIGNALTAAAPWALNFGLPLAVVSAPFASKIIGDKQRENGWGSQSVFRNSREYDVMGIGGRNKNEIKVDVHFDELARAFTKVSSMNTRVGVDNSSRGDFFEALMTTEAM